MGYLDATGLGRFYTGLKSVFVRQSNIVNDLATTEAGKVLDARQGPILQPKHAAVTLSVAGWRKTAHLSETHTIADVSATVTVDDATFLTATLNAAGTTLFSHNGTAWTINSTAITLENYGITLTGTAASGDAISVTCTRVLPWAQTVAVTGMTANKDVICTPDVGSLARYIEFNVRCTEQGAATLVFAADAVPDAALLVNVLMFQGANA